MAELGLIQFIILLSALVTLFLIRAKDIISLILLNSLFSIITILMYLNLDAPDVAMTEAVVGILTSVFAIYTVKKLYLNGYEFEDSFKPLLFFVLLFFAGFFIYLSQDLPKFGEANFDQYYLKNTGKDIGIPSTITAILANYRGYDTLLETMVIFISGVAIYFVTKIETNAKLVEANNLQILIKTVTKFIFPILVLFALYIQMHGEVSPGGGFQAGAILGAAFILYAMIFNKNSFGSLEKLKNLATLGVLIYFATGLISFVMEKEFLNYASLLPNKILAEQLGIFLVELGVGIAVSSTMLLMFFCFERKDELSN